LLSFQQLEGEQNVLKVYVTDYDYRIWRSKKSIFEPIGAQVIGLQDRSGNNLAEAAVGAHAVLQEYARINATTIRAMTRCKVIARYGYRREHSGCSSGA
jgi:D-3-phosphoglycerate dehydrogenase